jgi:hypothetical protein
LGPRAARLLVPQQLLKGAEGLAVLAEHCPSRAQLLVRGCLGGVDREAAEGAWFFGVRAFLSRVRCTMCSSMSLMSTMAEHCWQWRMFRQQ